jgi:hypothetical protein
MRWIFLIWLLALPAEGHAETPSNLALIGTPQSLLLIPRGRPGCPEPVSSTGGVVFSNSCGCGTATFKVLDSVSSIAGGTYALDYSIGGWCDPGLHLFSGAQFLVFKASGQPHRWVEAVGTQDGEPAFYADQLGELIEEFGIDAQNLEFGPSESEICEEYDGAVSCELKALILASDLLDSLHITSRSSTLRP